MNTNTSRVAKPSRLMAGAFVALTMTLAGCASTYGANTVSPNEIGYASQVELGTISDVREVTIRPDNSILGAATGAVLGGLAGSELGGGDKAQTAGAVGGAVLGGLAGNELGKGMNTRRGFAYTVQLDSGRTVEVVQGADIAMYPGQRVNVTYGGGRTTVSPAQGYSRY
ncbi:glycine zipper 2TM domain-containing protein [Henriciella marina]|uniref:17 kDa surface antigen n=1 Tax=Henriciella marina TaxID=453851 RepID=A0ABT4LR88_9PROT|nr:glycine zipper 2TM domain-containing protein [Henriciella marina]MCZ4296872.1 glycine zipper 2TM domain-containing protein [Henriciella marina]